MVTAYLAYFGLAVFVAATHFIYDGRILLDHDLFFLNDFLFINYQYLDNPALYTSLLNHFVDFSGENCYVLPNLTLHLLTGVAHVGLYSLRAVNWLYLLLFLWGSWKIGEQLADRRAGWLCVVAALSLPIFDDFSRSYDFHFHALAFLLPAHALLLMEFDKISSWRRYALLGACIGLAISTHTISLVESVPLFLFAVFNLFRKQSHKRQWVVRIGTMILVALLAAQPVLIGLYDYYLAKVNFLVPQKGSATPLLQPFNAALMINMIREFIGPRFLILGGALTLFSLIQWLGKQRFRFQDLYMGICVAFYAGLAVDIIFNGGNRHDGMIFYAMLPPWLIATTYNLFAAAGKRRAVALLTAAVLLIGAWEKAEALRAFPLGGRAVDEVVRSDSRHWVNVQKDWMWASNDALRTMNLGRFVPADCRAYEIDAGGSIKERDPSLLVIPLCAATGLFDRQLDCKNPDLAPKLRFEAFLLPDEQPPASVIAALRARKRESDSETRSLYFIHDVGLYSLGVQQALIVISKPPKPDAPTPTD